VARRADKILRTDDSEVVGLMVRSLGMISRSNRRRFFRNCVADSPSRRQDASRAIWSWLRLIASRFVMMWRSVNNILCWAASQRRS